MTLKEALEAYLTEQASKDSAFAEKFNPEKMSACVTYVTNQARKHLQGRNGSVEDATVYKWARDFFNDGEAEKAEKDETQKTEAPETPVQPKVKSWEQAKEELEAKKHKAKKKKPAAKPAKEESGPKQLSFDFGED